MREHAFEVMADGLATECKRSGSPAKAAADCPCGIGGNSGRPGIRSRYIHPDIANVAQSGTNEKGVSAWERPGLTGIQA